MREKTILVVIPVREEHRELLEEAAPGNHFVYSSIREVSREQVQEADIILGNVPADKIGASKKLQWLQLNSAGADAYTGQGILDENTVVTTAKFNCSHCSFLEAPILSAGTFPRMISASCTCSLLTSLIEEYTK